MLRHQIMLALLLSALSGCGSDDSAASSDESDLTEKQSCSATFTWLQKDAYKSTAGRTTELWPPHTTTTLEVTCTRGGESEVVASAFMENHGTKPGAVDESGAVILQVVKSDTVTASKTKLLALVDAFESCDCESATEFLSMDTIQDDGAKQLLGHVIAYLETNLECPDGVEPVVAALESGDVAAALGAMQPCSWKDGASLEEGLDDALAALIAATQEDLAAFHVCNNDAELQAQLWQTFRSTKKVVACDAGASDVCRGPHWLYSP